MLSLPDVAADVVLPAVRAVFKDGEVSRLDLSHSDDSGESVLLSLWVGEEEFRDYVVQRVDEPHGPEDWRARLQSNLVDFVAESRFGWGRNREAGLD